ncbi:MAG: ferric reductase-like transmembrane domain-containing protein [Rhodobacteraceae bacterium]|nr:ferric reductase-like transmembrane domain-containing protein [Paracoccaceae bacterium]
MPAKISTFFSRISPYFLWLILAIPALGMLADLIGSDNPRIYGRLLHGTGEFSARFLIIGMMATPLMLLFKGKGWTRWMVKNRRYFGVAAFGYAALHTLFYILKLNSFDRVIAELSAFYIWTGWLAFLIFLPLAATSMDYAVRKLGKWWKPLQRWTYAAAVLTLLHWASLHEWRGWVPAAVHFGPLALLSIYRLWWLYIRRRPARIPA